MEAIENLKDFAIGSVPTVFYISNFISDAEHNWLVDSIYESPVSKWKSLKNRRLQDWGGIVHKGGLLPQELPPWLTRITRRIFDETGLFPSAINHVLINEYLPNQGIMAHRDGPSYFPVVAILSLGSPVVMNFTPHSSLGNCSTSTMMSCNNLINNNDDDEHSSDGGAHNEQLDSFSLLLMPRSLLIFKDKAYSDYLHGIKESEVQRFDEALNASEADGYNEELISGAKEIGGDPNSIVRTTNRVSLTCRLVPKVQRKLFKF